MQIIIMVLKFFSHLLFFVILSGSASSACFVDYKAKKNNPLRLHYGVVEINGSQCSLKEAHKLVEVRIAEGDWLLLEVMSLFDENGLEKRKISAGKYFLLY